jgi:hypothetical protein
MPNFARDVHHELALDARCRWQHFAVRLGSHDAIRAQPRGPKRVHSESEDLPQREARWPSWRTDTNVQLRARVEQRILCL